jgi:hypothetical protein
VTKEEFIGRAADALVRSDGHEPADVEPQAVIAYVEVASVALEAVGAWELLDACLGARSLVEELEAGGSPDVRRYGWGDTLRSAIAKAEGR